MVRTYVMNVRPQVLVALIGAFSGLLYVPTAEAAVVSAVERENLGTPMRSVNIRSAAVGALPDGRPVVYTVSIGNPVAFSVLDAESGALLVSHEVPGYTSSFDTNVSADGTVYFEVRAAGRPPSLMRYFPADDRLVSLGSPVDGELNINRTVSDEAGIVYGGTYPNAHVFRFDPSTGQFTDFGRIAEGETYARSVAVGNGKLYVGTGTSGQLYSIDLESGLKSRIELPEPQTFTYRLAFLRGLLFVYTSPSVDWLVYDPKTEQWVDRIPRNSEGGITPVAAHQKAYFVNDATRSLYEYDVKQRTFGQVAFADGSLSYQTTRAIGLGELGGPEWPGQSVIGVGLTGRLWHWNPMTGSTRWVDSQAVGGAVLIHTIGAGADGEMYMGGYFTAGVMARYLTREERSEQLPGPTQIEGITTCDGKTYFGTYPDGSVYSHDPAGPWSMGTNPRQLFSLIAQRQERPFALACAGGRLAVGSVGTKDNLDGMLSFYDPAADTLDIKGTVIDDHSVTALAARGDLLVGGTSVNQLGVEPTDPQARIFFWDLATDTLTGHMVPVPGATDISEVTFDDVGHIWGLTSNGVVFEVDPDTRQVLTTIHAVTGGPTDIWGIGSLFFGPDDNLYGSSSGKVFALDPRTGEVQLLDSGEFAAADTAGRIYYAQGSRLLRLSVAGS